MATRIVVLSAGNIEQVGTPYELYNFPRNKFVATFIGSPKMNLLPATLSSGVATIEDFGAVPVPGGGSGPITVGVRPEQFAIGRTGDLTVAGKVVLREYLGSEVFLHVGLPSGRAVLVKAPGKDTMQVGQPVEISIAADNAHYFGADGLRLAGLDKAAAA